MSLAEVLVASTLTLLLLITGYQILGSATSTASAVGNRSVNSTDAREAINSLEANLRFATGVWACTGTTTLSCPIATSSQSPSRTGLTALYVTNAAGGTQPSCDHWVITTSGLQEDQTISGSTTVVYTLPGVMAWMASPAATTQSAGFITPIANLVDVDLLVNKQATTSTTYGQFVTANAVTVNDLVAPDNLPSVPSTTPGSGSC